MNVMRDEKRRKRAKWFEHISPFSSPPNAIIILQIVVIRANHFFQRFLEAAQPLAL